jgi:hypothetical protein
MESGIAGQYYNGITYETNATLSLRHNNKTINNTTNYSMIRADYTQILTVISSSAHFSILPFTLDTIKGIFQ